MAKASNLIIGNEYTVISGPFKGKDAVIVSNTVIPDGAPHQRTIPVMIEGVQQYLLPRLIDDGGIKTTTTSAGSMIDASPITDPMDERLDMYRPSQTLVNQYISRKIGNMTDIELLMAMRDMRDNNGYSPNIMLVGDTQSGKTMLVQVLACLVAKKMGYHKPLPVFTLSGSAGVTDFDLFGQPTVWMDANGVERVVWLPGVLEMGTWVPCIVYFDETNMMMERVTSSLHPYCDDRRTFVNRAKASYMGGAFLAEQSKVHKDAWIIGTYNAGYRGAGQHNEAFANRFRHIPWGYDREVEKALINSDSLVMLADSLREARRFRHINTPVGTKAMQRLHEDIDAFGVEVALWVFTGMFTEAERIKVEGILVDRSIKALIEAEFSGTAIAEEDPF